MVFGVTSFPRRFGRGFWIRVAIVFHSTLVTMVGYMSSYIPMYIGWTNTITVILSFPPKARL